VTPPPLAPPPTRVGWGDKKEEYLPPLARGRLREDSFSQGRRD